MKEDIDIELVDQLPSSEDEELTGSDVESNISQTDSSLGRLPVVGIGASAGGLKALEIFFENMPADSGAAFIVIQHLSPDLKSLMKELLERHTEMAVKVATEDIRLTPNTIFLIPPGQNMALVVDRLHLTSQDRGDRHQAHFPIDLFFESLAIQGGPHTIAIVLSGTGSDGSRGIQTVSEAGGIIMVQDPSTAEFDGMPYSAIETGLAELVLPPSSLASTTYKLITSPEKRLAFKKSQNSCLSSPKLQQIIDILKSCEDADFSQYKTTTLNRRITRRATVLGHSDLDSYILKLKSSEKERASLRNELLITVTRFFRDALAWEFLEREVLPSLIESATLERPLRIWITACATGEEAYSMAMLVQELLAKTDRSVDVKIFATDIDTLALAKASSGIYSAAALENLSSERREAFFQPKDGKFEVVRSLRETITFANHNLARDAAFTRIDLVSCRNVLIYMQFELQQRVLKNLHFALKVNGVLFLGKSENLGGLEKEFLVRQDKWKIYQKLRNVRLSMSPGSLSDFSNSKLVVQPKKRPPSISRFDPLIESALTGLLRNRKATCFLVDRANELIHLCGDALGLLKVSIGRASQDVVKMLPESLQFSLSTGLYRANQSESLITYRHCCITEDDFDVDTVSMEISRHQSLSAGSFLMVLIEEENETISSDCAGEFASDGESEQYVSQLQQELYATRESLQATIEELETTNEEQQATNEELIAANEELQSTNEELHSVNEEMHTVNAEYQSKIKELVQLNSDFDNLLNSADIGVIFLDNELKIRQFNSAATLAFNLVETDVNRPLVHLSHNLEQFNLSEALELAQQQTQHIEQSVRVEKGGPYLLLHIYPCIADGKAKDGWILTTVDVDAIEQSQRMLKEAQADLRQSNLRLEDQIRNRTAALRSSEQLLQSIAKAAPNVIYVYDLVNRCNMYANSGLEKLLGYSEAEIQLMPGNVIEALIHPDDVERLHAHHQTILDSDADDEYVFSLEYRIRNVEGAWRDFYTQDVIFARSENGQPTQILGTAIDVSDRKAALLQTQKSEARYRALYQRTPVMMHSVNPSGILISVSDQWLLRLGYHREDVIGKPASAFLQSVEGEVDDGALPAWLQPEGCYDLPYQLVCNNGQTIDVQLSTVAEYNEQDDIEQMLAVMIDVTERNKAELELTRYREHLEEMVDSRADEINQANQRLRAEAIERQKTQADLARYTQALERSNASLEEFAYVVSHDLQEPLRAMTVFSQLLEQRYKESLEKTATDYLDNIVQGGMRMQALIDGILDFSRITHQQQGFSPVDLNSVLDELAVTLQLKLQEARAELTYSSLPTVLADSNQISQIFQNLISNAIKFCDSDSPQIHIYAEPLSEDLDAEDDSKELSEERAGNANSEELYDSSEDNSSKAKYERWLIAVRDNGIGIPPEQQARIFTLFQRLHTRQEIKGHGIGLSICKKIVERHYGRMWVESLVGEGSTFYFTLEVVG